MKGGFMKMLAGGLQSAENAIAVEKRTMNGKNFETGVFDIVLERDASR